MCSFCLLSLNNRNSSILNLTNSFLHSLANINSPKEGGKSYIPYFLSFYISVFYPENKAPPNVSKVTKRITNTNNSRFSIIRSNKLRVKNEVYLFPAMPGTEPWELSLRTSLHLHCDAAGAVQTCQRTADQPGRMSVLVFMRAEELWFRNRGMVPLTSHL